MARVDFTDIRTTMETLVGQIGAYAEGLRNTANEQRKELRELYQRMTDTRDDLLEMGEITDAIATDMMKVSAQVCSVAEKVDDVFGGAEFLPDCDYEKLVDFCSDCGRAISEDDPYDVTDGWVVCADCADKRATEDAE